MSKLITLEEYARRGKGLPSLEGVLVGLPLDYTEDVREAKKNYPASEWARHVFVTQDLDFVSEADGFITVEVPAPRKSYQKNITQKLIDQYVYSCTEVVKFFAEKYFDFDINHDNLEDYRVVHDKLDNTWEFGDMFFSLNDILVALQDDIDFDVLTEWYWNNLECFEHNVTGFPNLHNYAAYPEIRKLGQELVAKIPKDAKPFFSKNSK